MFTQKKISRAWYNLKHGRLTDWIIRVLLFLFIEPVPGQESYPAENEQLWFIVFFYSVGLGVLAMFSFINWGVRDYSLFAFLIFFFLSRLLFYGVINVCLYLYRKLPVGE